MGRFELLEYQEEVCHDPEHHHQDPVQQMARLRILDREIEVTKDGEKYNARVPGGRPHLGLSLAGFADFVLSLFGLGGE